MMFKKIEKAINFFIILVTRKIHIYGQHYVCKSLLIDGFAKQAASVDYEPEMVCLYQRELSVGNGVFIDVGANFGQTLLSVLGVDEKLVYLGIDPQPECAARIQSFIKINRFENKKIICGALGLKNRISELEFSYEGDVRASIEAGYRDDCFFTDSVPVLTIPGDELVESLGYKEVQFIKIDVEGAELQVLESFRKTINTHKPTLTFEVLPDTMISTGENISLETKSYRAGLNQGLDQFIESVGYTVWLLEGDKELPIAIAADPKGLPRNYVARFVEL